MTAGDGFLPLFAARCRDDPNGLFARFEGVPITYGALGKQADALSAAFRRAGIARGDRVAVMLRNSPAALALVFAMGQAGIVWVPVNAQQRGPGLRYIIDHSQPRMIIVEADLLPVLQQCEAALDGIAIVTHADDRGAALTGLPAEPAGFDEPLPAPHECFAILYTSGTTGPPKGVLLSHAMLRYAAEAVALVSQAAPGDVMFQWEPLYHIGGMQVLLLPLIRRVTLAMVRRFSASQFWEQARETGATHIHFLGGVLQLLLKQPPSPLDRSHGVRVAWGGGCPQDIWRPFEQRFGIPIRECYGMTEASSITTFNDSGTVGSVGHPVPWFSVELRDAENQPVPRGTPGEIVVRSHAADALFAGYFRNPEASEKALRDGALYTGDLGRVLDNGELAFLGRVSDSIRCKGENISAWEIERVVAAHPAVEDCAVIGVASETSEQDVKLFVKKREGETSAPAELTAWLADRLTPYQLPRYIAWVSDFERTPSQRIAKSALPRTTTDCWDRLSGKERS